MSSFEHCCESLASACADPEVALNFIAKYRVYGIRILDGGSSYLRIEYCPWSGHKLPPSLRGEWFSHLEAMGIDPAEDPIPLEFQDETWYIDLAIGKP